MALEDLAHLSNRSLSSFKRDFQKYYNESPSRYIKNKKLEKAAELLKSSSLNLTDILFECVLTMPLILQKSLKISSNKHPANLD